MDKFQEIRPYYDAEAEDVIRRVLANDDCIAAVTKLKFPRIANTLPWLLKPAVRMVLKRQLKPVKDVHGFQQVVAHYMDHMIETTTDQFTSSGIEALGARPYLFMSNHRDIALDPAFVNYSLYHNGRSTVRIAIGDNLLTQDYVSDLMRLNKSFIVKRSAKGPRQILAAYRLLSQYIRFSITEENHPVWMAQREGRAKDGCDKTEPAIIKMLAMSQAKSDSLSQGCEQLGILPVAISYEYDPCDQAKARELYHLEHDGAYEKGEQEDIASIALGIAGQKGDVHVAYGQQIAGEFAEAVDVAEAMDQQIISNYILHSSNYFAYQMLYDKTPQGVYSAKALPFEPAKLAAKRKQFEARVAACDKRYQPYLLKAYANSLEAKAQLGLVQV